MLRNKRPVASSASQASGSPGRASGGDPRHKLKVSPLCASAVPTRSARRTTSERMAKAAAPAASGTRVSNTTCMQSVLEYDELVDVHVVEFAADVEDGDPHHKHRHE